MKTSALQHQIANTLSAHGGDEGMTQTELAKHTGAGVRCISRALGEMGNIHRSGRGVSGSPFRYEYVPQTIFCESGLNDKYKKRPFKFWATITMAPLFIGLVSGLMWN